MTQTDLPLFGCLRRNKVSEAIRQAEEMERLVRPYACNVLISYINEPFPNGQGRPHRNLVREELEQFFDMANRIVRLCNPERVIKCVDGDYDPPVATGMPDNHCYCGWYIGHAIDLGRLNAGFWIPVAEGWHYGCGEFGSEGLDNLEVMREFYPEGWLPASDQNAFAPWRPVELIDNQTNHFQYLWFPSQKTPSTWIEASQRHQAWITRLMTEAFRRDSRMNSFAIHLFIDAWPCGWMKAIVDVLRIPKKAFFAYREALTPLMVSLRSDRHSYFSNEVVEMEAWICNDTHEAPVGAHLRYQLEINGQVVQSGRATAKVPLCSSRPQGLIRFSLPKLAERTTAKVQLALLDKSNQVLFDTEQEIKVFPELPCLAPRRAFIIGSRTGVASSLAAELGLTLNFTGTPQASDIIMIDDLAMFADHQATVERAVQAGGTAVFLELPAGQHRVMGSTLKVVAGGMGPRHFVECGTGHILVKNLEPYDFWFWHDDSVGHPTPILTTVFDPPTYGWSTILGSGNGSWSKNWKSVPAALEKNFGEGIIRACQVKLANRTRTNPSAAIFARRLLNLDSPIERNFPESYSGENGIANGKRMIKIGANLVQLAANTANRQQV
jgi:hypothetical protein